MGEGIGYHGGEVVPMVDESVETGQDTEENALADQVEEWVRVSGGVGLDNLGDVLAMNSNALESQGIDVNQLITILNGLRQKLSSDPFASRNEDLAKLPFWLFGVATVAARQTAEEFRNKKNATEKTSSLLDALAHFRQYPDSLERTEQLLTLLAQLGDEPVLNVGKPDQITASDLHKMLSDLKVSAGQHATIIKRELTWEDVFNIVRGSHPQIVGALTKSFSARLASEINRPNR